VSQFRLFIDEDSAEKAVLAALRNAKLDILTVAEVGRLSYSDEDQLTWAAQQGRVLYSYNARDFCQLHDQYMVEGKTHAGIILVPQQRYSVGQLLRGFINLMKIKSAEDMVDQLVFLSPHIKSE
jgi:hypothetical protein